MRGKLILIAILKDTSEGEGEIGKKRLTIIEDIYRRRN